MIESNGVVAVAIIGEAAVLTGDFSDLDGDEVVITSSIGMVMQSDAKQGKWSWLFDVSAFNDSQEVFVTATDEHGVAFPISFSLLTFNQVPIPADDAVSTLEDTAFTIAADFLTANDIDVDSPRENLAVADVFDAVSGSVGLNSDGSINFSPTASFSGFAEFSYALSDEAQTVVGHVTVFVYAVNDAPVAVAD